VVNWSMVVWLRADGGVEFELELLGGQGRAQLVKRRRLDRRGLKQLLLTGEKPRARARLTGSGHRYR
jgi:hypothetical protein